MRLDRYLAKSRIIDIRSKDLKGALKELLDVSLARLSEKLDSKKLLKAILKRESVDREHGDAAEFYAAAFPFFVLRFAAFFFVALRFDAFFLAASPKSRSASCPAVAGLSACRD